MESQNKRGQNRSLYQVLELQTGECKTKANGLVGFLRKKLTELLNTGHMMDDEMFIAHLLNSLPQSEYEGAILAIKDKLRKGVVDLPEIEQILEDKYQATKHVKGWEEEKDDYALFTSQFKKEKAQEGI